MKLTLIILALTFLSTGVAHAKAKKLIEYGWDCPTTAYTREHIAEMEKVPFDGIMLAAIPAPGSANMTDFGCRAFGKERLDANQLQSAIADIKATHFKRFRSNFIRLITLPGDIDWFDPEWSTVAHNSGVLAMAAKRSGCKGLMFDPECYNTAIWTYNSFPESWKKSGHTFAEYQAKIRERGREFMTAVNKEFPDITILCLFGPTANVTLWPDKPEGSIFGLLRWFYQGMLDVATPGTIIVDGWEASYGNRTRDQFVEARKTITQDTAHFYEDPAAYNKHVRCGFGIWTDHDWRNHGWSYTDFTKNYHSPVGFRASLNYAMELADEYVWVYSEELRWWNPARAPKPYIDALALAKIDPGPGAPLPPVPPPIAAQQAGYSDQETFAEYRKTLTEVLDLPKDGWRFSKDPDKTGQVKGWHKPGFDDSLWDAIGIGKFWEEQGPAYDGCAWYRRKFTAPAIDPAKRVYLCFGAADETALVWLNGRYVGKQDIGPSGWDKPFALDVTGTLLPGADNLLAVRVIDTFGGGGLWKSIKLMVEK